MKEFSVSSFQFSEGGLDSQPLPVPPTEQERVANWKAIQRLSVANRFRLMFGQPLLPENGDEPEGRAAV